MYISLSITQFKLNKCRLAELTTEFEHDFPYQAVPSLPTILSTISTSTHKQTDNHFFATVVKSKDLIPLYQDVVIWMLKRDLLVTLHLRVRTVATPELKQRVRLEREQAKARRIRTGEDSETRGRTISQINEEVMDDGSPTWLSLSPKTARRETRRLASQSSARSKMSDHIESLITEDEDEDEIGSSDPDNEPADDAWPSMIGDPGRATPKERRWLSAMSQGKDPYIVKRFEL
jgi:nitrogen permease regulator 3-like protein